MGGIIDVQRGSECSRVVIDAATVSLYCIVLYWFEAAPPAAADKGFARFRSYVPNLMVMVAALCEARWSRLSGLPLSRSYAMSYVSH